MSERFKEDISCSALCKSISSLCNLNVDERDKFRIYLTIISVIMKENVIVFNRASTSSLLFGFQSPIRTTPSSSLLRWISLSKMGSNNSITQSKSSVRAIHLVRP